MPVIASSSLARAAPVAASARASQTRPPRAPPRVAAASRSSRVVVGFLRSPRRGPILPPLAHRAVVQEDCDADCVAETWEELEAEVANEVVGNVMTPRANVSCARASDNVLDALEVLVSNRHSGVPVLDDDERVVGVISEYDLMVRIGREGKKQSEKDDGMFPKIGRCDEFGGSVKDMWSRFIDLQDRMEKAQVTTVREAMHDAMTCTPETLLVDATDAMLNERRHRICVVDEDDKARSIHWSPYDRVGVVNADP